VRTPNLVSTSTWSSYLPRTLNSWFLKTRLIIMSAESIPETPRTPVIKLEVRLLLCHVRQFHYDLDSYGKNLSLLQFARYGTLPFLSKTWSFVEIVIFFSTEIYVPGLIWNDRRYFSPLCEVVFFFLRTS
jgi:hypothetical protein